MRSFNVQNYINVDGPSPQATVKLDNNADIAIIDTSKFLKNTTSRQGRGDMSPIECRRTIPDAASHIRHIQKGVPDQEYNQAGSDLFNEAMGVGGAVDTHGHIRGHQIAVQDSNSKNLLKIDNFVTDLNSSDISPNGPSPEKVFKIDGKKKEKMSARRNRSEFRNSH